MNRQRLILALGCALVAILLGAPAPGHVGGCGVESIPADPQAFCQERERVECQRRERRGEITTPAELSACIAGAPMLCVGFTFGVNCVPTTNEATACIDALRNINNLTVPRTEIAECRALCD